MSKSEQGLIWLVHKKRQYACVSMIPASGLKGMPTLKALIGFNEIKSKDTPEGDARGMHRSGVHCRVEARKP